MSASIPRMPAVGEFAPEFACASDANPQFRFGTLGGVWVVLFFFGSLSPEPTAVAHAAVVAARALFDDRDAQAFGVSIDPADRNARGLKNSLPGLRYFWDFDTAVSRAYGVAKEGVYAPTAFLIDRQLRVVAIEPASRIEALLDRLRRELALEKPAIEHQFAPVLTLPRIFEPELCRALIDYYAVSGGTPSGHMTTIEGRTVGQLDTRTKRRKDAQIDDPILRATTCSHISYRLIPAVQKFLGWRATRIERYIVACYSGEDQGFFKTHRDNTTPGTAHRKFAVTINLNAEDYDGGELRFPEFGPRTYKPPTGGAVVFCCSLLHEATPVTRGLRYAFLPFLYDEAGKRIRDANAHTVEDAPVPETV